MATEFTFRIAGSYSPADIPLERLGEYLTALGELFGEAAHVHFGGLSEGSTLVHARVDEVAAPKVERRVRAVAAGDAPKAATKAFERLDDMLRDDNATGHLAGGDSNVIHVDFPGRNRPEEIPFGPIKQLGSLDGEVFRVEGRDATVHVGIMDGTEIFSLEAPVAMGKELAGLYRDGIVRFHGEGTWYRHGDGRWELRKFRIDRFEGDLDAAPVSDAIARLRAAGPGRWADSPDPLGELRTERDDGASAH